jgi:glycosyl transferase family 1
MKKELAFIVAAADGIRSLQTGVGVVVSFFFESFDEIKEEVGCKEVDLFAVCPKVNENSVDFCSVTTAMASEACFKNGGKVIQLPNLSSGNSLNEIWKGTENYTPGEVWESCCKSLAEYVSIAVEKYNRVYVLLHDTLFINVSAYLSSDKIKICWIPHSLGTLFSDPNQEGRIRFEKNKIQNLLCRGDKIGFISYYTKEHLIKNYAVQENSLLSFYSGIYFESKKYLPVEVKKSFCEEYSIPMDKKIIFTWGRCSDQKGIDIIIKAYAGLVNRNTSLAKTIHLFLLCPTETSYPDYLTKIRAILDLLPAGSYTFIERFQLRLQYEILKYANTKVILLCSRFESFGLASIEALFQRESSAYIIYSPIPTFIEVLGNSHNTVELKENSASELEDTIERVIMKEENTGQQLPPVEMSESFSFVKNYSFGINQMLSH